MRFSYVLFQVFRFLLPPCIITSVWLHFYPFLHGCSFPTAKRGETVCYFDAEHAQNAAPDEIAPFRLLALGDPQLEGDTSLPDPNAPFFPSLHALRTGLSSEPLSSVQAIISKSLLDFGRRDVPTLIRSYRKRIDLWGNDYYLAHVFRSVHGWTKPTHTAVLGDLLGSQWIGDEEFARRSNRYWHRVFKGTENVPEELQGSARTGGAQETQTPSLSETLHDQKWSKRLINVVGNHDIGYAGDIDEDRIARFEQQFGKVNWDIRFRLSPNMSESLSSNPSVFQQHSPELRLVVLNSMNLDSPAWTQSAQDASHAFLDQQSALTRQQHPEDATVLLTHIPLQKEAGVCVDGPFFDYFPPDQGGGIKEQNHLSMGSSRKILDGLFRDPQTARGIILNGHDHEGCDSYHYRNMTASPAGDGNIMPGWDTVHYLHARSLVNNDDIHGIREITVRSMMGNYGGNAGLLSGWFDTDAQRWKFEYSVCVFGIQHFWWVTHGLQVIVLLLGLATSAAALLEVWSEKVESKKTSDLGTLQKKNS